MSDATHLVTLRRLWHVRPRTRRWPYLLPGLLGLLFVVHAYEDDGWRSAAVYLALLIGSVAQGLRPTLLGWAVVVVPLAILAPVVFGAYGGVALQDWILGAALWAVPVMAVLVGHPWRRASGLVPGGEGRRITTRCS
jgi:hypothetical protein